MESQELTVVAPDIQAVVASGVALLQKVKKLKVVDEKTFKEGGDLLTAIRAQRLTFEPGMDKKCEEAHGIHRFMTQLRAKALAPYLEGEQEVKRGLGNYQFQQEEKRREEAARLARKAQIEAEEKRKVEIEAARRAKDAEAVRELKAAPIIPEVPMPKTQEPPKLPGTSFRTIWKFKIVEESKIPRSYLMPNETAIGATVRALGDKSAIPGITVYREQVVSKGGV